MDGATMHGAILSEHRLIRRLTKIISELDLDSRDFAIFGSGPMFAHGLRKEISDLDLVAREEAWQSVSRYGTLKAIGATKDTAVLFWGGLITFFNSWISADWNINDVIDQAEIVQGLPFAQLTDVLAYKQAMLRPKDLPDIKALQHYFLLHSDSRRDYRTLLSTETLVKSSSQYFHVYQLT